MSSLRDRRFRRLWVAGLISDTGDWLLLVSLPILVYQYTHSTLGTATAFLIELAPPVLLAELVGRIADRPDRRRTLVAVSLGQAVALTPLLLVNGASGLPVVYAVVLAQSALAAVFDPTKSALLPTLVADHQLLSANSLVGLNQNMGRLVGGSLGGGLLAVGGGLSLIVAADGVSFLLAAALIAGLGPPPVRHRPAPVDAPGDASAGSGDAGWAAALSPPPVRAGLLVVLIAGAAQGIFVVLFVVFVARVLHGGSAETGLLRGVQAIGAIAAGVALTVSTRTSAVRLTAGAAIAFGLLDLAIWNGPELTRAEPLYIALFIAVGAPGTALVTGLTSAMQLAGGDDRRGRVFAAVGFATAIGQAAGMLGAGLLGDPLGVLGLLNFQGALYLVAGLAAARGLGRDAPSGRLTACPTSISPTSNAWRSGRWRTCTTGFGRPTRRRRSTR